MAFDHAFPTASDMQEQTEVARAAKPRIDAIGLAVLSFVVISFCYEIPLVYISSFYKGNPYLFDVAAFTLVFYWIAVGRGRGWTLRLDNPVLGPWLALVGVFVFVTLIAGTWMPMKTYVKSVWYLFKYIEGTLVLVIVLSAPLDERAKRRLLWTALLGGTWVAFYTVLQMAGIVGTARVIPKGWEITREGSGYFSTLGVTYFHAGFFGAVSTLVGVAVFQSSRGFARMVAMVLAPFSAIPAIVAGSRAAFMGLIIALGFLALQPRYRKAIGAWLMAAVMIFSIQFVYQRGYTKERSEVKGYQRSSLYRLGHGFKTLGLTYDTHGPLLFVAGGGFMGVPIRREDGSLQYRSGYGNHNIHLFPLEQAGIAGFAVTMWLWWRLGSSLWRRRHPWPMNALDETYRNAMAGFFGAMLIVGWSGTSFWILQGTEHFCIYEMLLFGIALAPTGDAVAQTAKRPDLQEWSPFHEPVADTTRPSTG